MAVWDLFKETPDLFLKIRSMGADGGLGLEFGDGQGANGPVLAVALVPGGPLLIGGEFTDLGGRAAPGFAVLDPETGEMAGRSYSVEGRVESIRVSGGKVFLGGPFTSPVGESLGGLVVLGLATWDWVPWGVEVGGVVHGLRLNLIEFYNWAIHGEGHPFRAFRKKETITWTA